MKKLNDGRSGFGFIRAKMSMKLAEDENSYKNFYADLSRMMDEHAKFVDECLLIVATNESLEPAQARSRTS